MCMYRRVPQIVGLMPTASNVQYGCLDSNWVMKKNLEKHVGDHETDHGAGFSKQSALELVS